MNIQPLKFRRQRPSTKARFNKIRDNHEIHALAGGKYCGLRGPLLFVSIGFAGFILSASMAYEQESAAGLSASSPGPKLQVAGASTPSPVTEKLPEYTVVDAKKHIGENATVLMRVDCVRCVTGCYLSFGDCGGDATFFIHVPSGVLGPELDVNKLKGVTVAVTGKIKKGQSPYIQVQSTSQIVVPREPTPDELETAIARASKAIEANSRDASAYYQRGLAQEKKAALHQSADDYHAAMDDYNHAVKLDPSNADALVHIGDCYRSIGQHDRAQREYDKAIEVSPKAKALLASSIEAERARHCYAAIDDLDELNKMEPNNAALYYRKAKLYMMDHSNEQANVNFQKASELDPTNLTYGLAANHPLAPSKELTSEQLMNNIIEGTAGAVATVFGAAAWSDSKAYSDSQRVVKSAHVPGHKQVKCPVCHGRGFFREWEEDLYSWDKDGGRTGHWVEVTCSACHGTRYVDE
jgi:Tetratricopeptide repeat